MARFNKIFIGPVTEATPQVHEATGATALMPGTVVIRSGTTFVQANATTKGRVFIVQDNYLAMKTVDTAWPAGDRVCAMALIDEQAFAGLVPTGNNIAIDTPLTTDANGRLVAAVSGKQVMAFAAEAYNNTSGVDQLIRVRPDSGYIMA